MIENLEGPLLATTLRVPSSKREIKAMEISYSEVPPAPILPSTPIKKNKLPRSLGLTLIELLVTVTIIAATFVLIGSRLGVANFWKEEGFLRKFRETITFLYQQAVVDQVYYQLQVDFEKQEYQIFAVKAEGEEQSDDVPVQEDVGYLTQELAAILSPAIGSSYTLIAPPSFPSLGEAVQFPGELKLTSIKTARGNFDARETDKAYILFSPRGFSEFAVIHFDQGSEGKVTILINPFVGSTEIFREDRDFDWTYGRKNKNS